MKNKKDFNYKKFYDEEIKPSEVKYRKVFIAEVCFAGFPFEETFALKQQMEQGKCPFFKMRIPKINCKNCKNQTRNACFQHGPLCGLCWKATHVECRKVPPEKFFQRKKRRLAKSGSI